MLFRCVPILLALLVASPGSHASYAQFCRMEGRIVSQPNQDSKQCIHFKFEVSRSIEFEQRPFGQGWGNCKEHVGKTIDVSLTPPFQGQREFREGQLRSIWRDAMDMEVAGEMCTVVGFSAVDPNTVEID